MHGILRSINQTVKGLATRIPRLATTKELLTQHPRVLFRRTSTQQPQQPLKNLGVPNPSWSQELLDQFEKFTKMSEDGSWQHFTNFEKCVDILAGRWKELQNHKRHTFFESVGGEGKGFEYAMFKNPSEKRVMAVFQLGPYLEGPSGFVHGRAIAAILDQTIVACIIFLKSKMMTANLNVKYKCPMALGSMIVVDTKVVKIEGRKVFTSSEIQNVDGQTLHVEATSLLIKLFAPERKRFQQLPVTDNLDAHRPSSASTFLFLNSPTTSPSQEFHRYLSCLLCTTGWNVSASKLQPTPTRHLLWRREAVNPKKLHFLSVCHLIDLTFMP